MTLYANLPHEHDFVC